MKTGHKYCLINYFDVWGNETDGWEVNDQCYVGDDLMGDTFYITDDATNKEILNYLVEIGFLTTSDMRKLAVDQYTYAGRIEIYERKGMKPLCAFEEIYE